VSPASLSSAWVTSEWSAALGRSIRVIPVLVGGASVADLPVPLTSLQAVDLNGDYAVELRRLVTAIGDLHDSSAPPASTAIDVDGLARDIAEKVYERLGPLSGPADPDCDAVEDDLVFVVCSFEAAMEPIFESIAAAAKTVGLRAERM
jgi:hypothetical protein